MVKALRLVGWRGSRRGRLSRSPATSSDLFGPLLESLLIRCRRVFLSPDRRRRSAQQFVGGHDVGFGCSLSSPLRKIRRIVPNWLAKVTIWAWAGVTSKETVLPWESTSCPGPWGPGLGARDVVDGKYSDVLQDGLAEGLANSQVGIRSKKTCTSQRDPGSTSPLWIASGPTGTGTTRSPLGTRPSVGTWPRARSLGSMIGSPAKIFCRARRPSRSSGRATAPGRNSILGPLL